MARAESTGETTELSEGILRVIGAYGIAASVDAPKVHGDAASDPPPAKPRRKPRQPRLGDDGGPGAS